MFGPWWWNGQSSQAVDTGGLEGRADLICILSVEEVTVQCVSVVLARGCLLGSELSLVTEACCRVPVAGVQGDLLFDVRCWRVMQGF